METTGPITSDDLFSGLKLHDINEQCPTGRLLLAGDLYPGGRAEALLKGAAEHGLWGDLSGEMARHDLCVANLECPLTDNDSPILKSGPSFRADPECAKGIISGGFDAVSLANNHIKDMGEAGVIDSIAACERAGLRTVGAGMNLEEASRPLFVSINGLRVGVLAFAEHEFSTATRGSAGTCPLDLATNFRQIRTVRDQADFVLVIFHGGVEYYSLPTPAMAKRCRFFAEAGADAVVCHHVHVPSGVEIYNNVPIIYSTGNFLFDWWPTVGRHRFSGYMVSLDVQGHVVAGVRLIPYYQSIDDCRVRMMADSESEIFLSGIAELSETICDETLLQQKYEHLVQSKRHQYLTAGLILNRVERRLLKMGIWPFWRTSHKHLARLKNQFSCESHQELMVSVLNSELNDDQRV